MQISFCEPNGICFAMSQDQKPLYIHLIFGCNGQSGEKQKGHELNFIQGMGLPLNTRFTTDC